MTKTGSLRLGRSSRARVHVLAICLLIAGLVLPAGAEAASRRKGPYLIGAGNPYSMTVLWQLDETAGCILEWGRDTNYAMGRVETSEYGNDHQHRYTIVGLEPGTLYHYRVWMGGQPYEGAFRTAPPSDSESAAFLVYGDTRSYPEAHGAVAEAMLARIAGEPEAGSLVVVVGDLVSHGREEADWDEQLFDPGYNYLQRMFATVPYHSCAGNHEFKGQGSEDLFLKYFPYQWTAAHYGSFDYGPAHFTFVDQYTDYTPGSAQYAWIVSDLANTRKPWRFVVLHEPGWSAGGHSDNEAVQRYLQPLFERYHVAMVFAGHNHYYARAVVNGIQHITTGGGGAPLYKPDPTAIGVVKAAESYHFCRVRIQGSLLDFEVIRPDGSVIDSLELSGHGAREAGGRSGSGAEERIGQAGAQCDGIAAGPGAPVTRSSRGTDAGR